MMEEKYQPPPAELSLPAILHALGDPARLDIARTLYTSAAPLTCLQAAQEIEGLPVSTRAHCFQVLRAAGLIVSRKKGRECYNSLRREAVEAQYPGLLAAILPVRSREQ